MKLESGSPYPPAGVEQGMEETKPATPRRSEIAFIGVFCVANLLVSAFFTDVYPYSSMPMYSASPEKITKFEIFDPDGNEVSRVHLRLYLPLRRVTNPAPRIGQKAPATLNTKDEILADEDLVPHVRKYLEHFPKLEYVTVHQKILGTVSADGRDTVGTVREKRWRIENPHYQRAEAGNER